jgi:hypothetical protein
VLNDDLIDVIAERVEARLTRSGRFIAQQGSPLGARYHRAAVKRRIERQEGGAYVDARQRRFLLTPDALEQELARRNQEYLEQRRQKKPGRNPELDALQRELVGGLRRLKEVR